MKSMDNPLFIDWLSIYFGEYITNRVKNKCDKLGIGYEYYCNKFFEVHRKEGNRLNKEKYLIYTHEWAENFIQTGVI
jgi:hypothetical protein